MRRRKLPKFAIQKKLTGRPEHECENGEKLLLVGIDSSDHLPTETRKPTAVVRHDPAKDGNYDHNAETRRNA